MIVYHEAKSKFAYLADKDTVHIRLQTSKHDIYKVEVLYGDPFFWAPKKNNPDVWEWKVQTSESTIMRKEYTTQQFDHYFIALKPEFKRMKYVFVINDHFMYGSHGLIDLSHYPEQKRNLFNYFNFPYLNEADLFDAPKWVENQVWYAIFPERFANGDELINPPETLAWGDTKKYSNSQRFGGDLQGIIDHLDYIEDMGFTGIYMTPIFSSDSAHKYDINDYYEIDSAFGDKETLKKLVDEAHKRGIKVMLDAVFNHCGFRHPYFQDVLDKGIDSKYYDCFYIIDKDKPLLPFEMALDTVLDDEQEVYCHQNPNEINYRTFAFTPKMPKMNTDNPLMKEYLLDVATYWIKEFDIDGWRLDVSNEVSHAFWRDFRKAVKAVKPDAYIIGENWDNSNPWLGGDQYDAVMNYEILFPIWNFFGTNIDHKNIKPTDFVEKISKVLTDYPKNVLRSMYNLVDSHDTTRLLEICNNDPKIAKQVYLFLFTFPGAPSIYYGGEVGLTGKHDPDNRRCMPWDNQNEDLKTFIKKLIQIRQANKDFKDVEFEWITADNETSVLVYKKGETTFIFNNSNRNQKVVLPEYLQFKRVLDVYDNKKYNVTEEVALKAYEFKIYQ